MISVAQTYLIITLILEQLWSDSVGYICLMRGKHENNPSLFKQKMNGYRWISI